jgi:hypothetical protein
MPILSLSSHNTHRNCDICRAGEKHLDKIPSLTRFGSDFNGPPWLSVVAIDGNRYWDGGLVSNSSLQSMTDFVQATMQR